NDAGLLGVITLLGLLMISSVRFPSFKHGMLYARFAYLVPIVFVAVSLFCVAYGFPIFFFVLLAYLIGGPLYSYRCV
ncbi:MAG: hypothetical protein Q8Q25_02995, partial [bacterium]|nr:hypothetical protein [bacterium]